MRKKENFESVKIFSLKFSTIGKYQILFVAKYSLLDVKFRVVEKFHENNCCKSLDKKKCIFFVQKNGSVFFR